MPSIPGDLSILKSFNTCTTYLFSCTLHVLPEILCCSNNLCVVFYTLLCEVEEDNRIEEYGLAVDTRTH